MQRIAVVVGSVLAAVILGFFLVRAIQDRSPGDSKEDLGGGHVDQSTTVTEYNSEPPTSGQHWSQTDTWGVHTEPIPNELQVHNLEHGGVIIQYNSTVTPEEIAELQAIVEQCNVKLILAPRPDMPSRIAVTAWTHILTLETVDRDQIQEFIDAWIDKGPERITSESVLLEDCF